MQQNYAQGESEDETDSIVEENHFFKEDYHPIFLTENEEYVEKMEEPKDKDYILENDYALETQSDDYQRGYLNSLSSQQKQYSLRNKDVSITPIQKRTPQLKDTQQKTNPQGNQSKVKGLAAANQNKVNQPST